MSQIANSIINQKLVDAGYYILLGLSDVEFIQNLKELKADVVHTELQRSKLDAKVKKCICIGFDEQRKGWRCMDPVTYKFTVSRDMVFDEVSSYYAKAKVNLDAEPEMTTLSLTPSPKVLEKAR
ncbi:hypothetical protein GH714_031247 [Hevea brasiliensis]|uniref:Retroviral polymerase SH3-like domain-containing protein n=1 Tax=Hevea brasiliensis TaxID=3981 RepID=A0A6A6N8F7_HEVBR|nr:hypothetical protein GH714_031247 [Hevea brasiliensis]